jgi:hypothetical protein
VSAVSTHCGGLDGQRRHMASDDAGAVADGAEPHRHAARSWHHGAGAGAVRRWAWELRCVAGAAHNGGGNVVAAQPGMERVSLVFGLGRVERANGGVAQRCLCAR